MPSGNDSSGKSGAWRRWLGAVLLTTSFGASGAGVALVIGNQNYQSSPPVPTAAADARAVAESLRKLGFTLVGGDAQLNASRSEMLRHLRSLTEEAGADRVALIYFSGHGVGAVNANYLLPVDDASISSPDDVEFVGVSVASALRRLQDRGGGTNLLILDASRDNPRMAASKRGIGGRGLSRPATAVGAFIAFAASPGQVSVESGGAHSTFTQAFLDRLQRPGIRVDDLFSEVTRAVRTGSGDRQVPMSWSNLEAPFHFSQPTVGATAVSGAESEQLFWQSVRGANDERAVQEYLSQYPEGRFAAEARSLLSSLQQGDRRPQAPTISLPVDLGFGANRFLADAKSQSMDRNLAKKLGFDVTTIRYKPEKKLRDCPECMKSCVTLAQWSGRELAEVGFKTGSDPCNSAKHQAALDQAVLNVAQDMKCGGQVGASAMSLKRNVEDVGKLCR